ncbi:hypothetical protein KCU61_g566, partial [Aureobasidium melanogenum]
MPRKAVENNNQRTQDQVSPYSAMRNAPLCVKYIFHSSFKISETVRGRDQGKKRGRMHAGQLRVQCSERRIEEKAIREGDGGIGRDGGLKGLWLHKDVSLAGLLLVKHKRARETHVDVFGQQLVGDAVLVNDVVVEGSSAQDGTREESKDTVQAACQSCHATAVGCTPGSWEIAAARRWYVSYPPRKAPTGLRTGMAPAGTSSNGAELWKLRRIIAGVERLAARRRAGIDIAREAIVCL